MIRTLLTTTALAALMGTAVIAQDVAPATETPMAPDATVQDPIEPAIDAPEDGAMENAGEAVDDAIDATGDAIEDAGEAIDDPMDEPMDTTTAPSLDAEVTPTTVEQRTFELGAGFTAVDTDNLVTRLIGMPVYSSAADDAEEIGNVSDLVFTQEGQLEAVVIGVGGFLGIGEKLVAADFDELQFTIAADNTERWVLPTTAEALETAPDFVWEDDAPTDMMDPALGDPAMAPADPMMAPADPAMAPADPAMAPAEPAIQ